MKPTTTLIGLLTSLAVLGTTSALATSTLLSSFEGNDGDAFPISTTPPTDGWNTTATFSAMYTSGDGVTEGDTSVEVDLTAAQIGWAQALIYSDGYDLVTGSTTESNMLNILIPALDAGQLNLAIDITCYNMSWAVIGDFVISGKDAGTIGGGSTNWAEWKTLGHQFSSLNLNDVPTTSYLGFDQADVAGIEAVLNSRKTHAGDGYSGLNFYVQGSIVAGASLGTFYFDNLRVYDGLWETANAVETNWYGQIYAFQTGEGWIWSVAQNAFQYASGTSIANVFVWDFTLGWTYTNNSYYPYFYVYGVNQWAYYLGVTNGVRWYMTWTSDGSVGWSTAEDLAAGVLTVKY
jgi:hypothetical protein